jgi:hypothetical protein
MNRETLLKYADELDLLAADNDNLPASLDEHAHDRADTYRMVAEGIRIRCRDVETGQKLLQHISDVHTGYKRK